MCKLLFDSLKQELPLQLKSLGFSLCRHPLMTFTGGGLDGIFKLKEVSAMS